MAEGKRGGEAEEDRSLDGRSHNCYFSDTGTD
jgi:hypothetical protein